MKKIGFTILLLFLTVPFYAQKISGKIIDENNNSIAEARITIENEEIGELTDLNGNYTIDLTNIAKTKTLKVIVNEYEPFKIKISEFIGSQNQTIILKKKIINLDPVVVNPKKYTLKNYGTTNSKKPYSEYNSNDPNEVFEELAILVENKKKLRIKNVNVNIVNYKFDNTATFIFNIQSAKNGFPDSTKSLVNEPLQVTVTENDIKDNKISLDVYDKNIWTNEDFFVLVRIAEDFKGSFSIAGNIFAFSKDTFYRNYNGEWKKYSSGEPSINVDVLIEK
ncbi:hypothetical protein GON26_00470 [Flavobacterium sp. GA093]|uniref:CarboxypepD_reg-like domain-containing protein n=1 Tax=Flavobacterium hydrocarbonoxydans TaxID=2683249 RepID=A0A6I4NME9_9FLAO|nr:carboxypeptidase-like regulatory domain-containing protein [Flavobacterium hydrocarbonoxydans]MWB92829.1 hypothetical protein [Flavobacterium hydrocarbonoxydans]